MRSLSYLFLRRVPLLILVVLLLQILGAMPLWSQSSEQSLKNSNENSKTWEQLSTKFEEALTGQFEALSQASKELQASKNYSDRLNYLLQDSWRLNVNLGIYNKQIAERMQERDTDLANAYEELNELDKQILKQKNTIFKLIMALCATSLLLITWLVLKLRKGFSIV